ncbi:copper resistance protein CopD [Malaciobacter canalis]|uniref:Copper resistance protein CopD n=1 Tax=Malaciobacter canalis TaxID=1912871 RepID=A0ABX4LQI7_9BACT|nr:copper resistance protein CopD [Malaciobacter canalis]PHO10207.1 copper resistance protein CopD [Malaciobacter canalis]QEE32697.1 putative membrane protein [Malaciobacter canalis]
MAYNIALIIHVFCAIFFVGFIFADVFVLNILDKKYNTQKAEEIKQTIYTKGVKIYPVCVLLLVLSGGYMFSKYVNSTLGYFQTNMQILLWIKLFLVLGIAIGVLYSLSCKFRQKKPMAFMKHFHLIALILAIIIVILAKVMFWV